MPFFGREGQIPVTTEAFLNCIGSPTVGWADAPGHLQVHAIHLRQVVEVRLGALGMRSKLYPRHGLL